MFEDARVVTWCIIICCAFFVSLFEGGNVKTRVIQPLLFSQSTGHDHAAAIIFWPPVSWWLKLHATALAKQAAACFQLHVLAHHIHNIE